MGEPLSASVEPGSLRGPDPGYSGRHRVPPGGEGARIPGLRKGPVWEMASEPRAGFASGEAHVALDLAGAERPGCRFPHFRSIRPVQYCP